MVCVLYSLGQGAKIDRCLVDFRKYGPCMDKAGNEIDAVCEQQCSAYERGLQKLENLTKDDNAADYDDYEISSLLNETCTYVAARSVILQRSGHVDFLDTFPA